MALAEVLVCKHRRRDHPRCRYTRERCKTDPPPLQDLGGNHFVACHFSEELKLTGVRMQ